ncbi:MAG TPA: hypothetical protein PKX05_00935 [bacterium]|nr:hypothetical protein [bacterium]
MEKVNCKILRLFILVSLIFPYIAFCASSAIRVLPGTYTAGETFDVSVFITPVSNAIDLILTETLPAGWTIVYANPGYNKYSADTNSYKWMVYQYTPPISPFTITYTVHVPEGTTGTHQIIGLLHTSLDDVVVTGNSVIVDQYLPTSVSMFFEQGWNLICLPVEPATPITAQDFLDKLNTQGAGATEINRWHNGAWQAHINELPFNNDFNIESYCGYLIKVNQIELTKTRVCGF